MTAKYRWKVCLVGDTGVGKSCIAFRFYQDRFTGVIPTIGYAFMEKELQVDEILHTYNLWDTAGQERYRSLARGFFRRASAMILVYDITDTVLDTYWIRSAQRGTPENMVLAIVGNKSDVDDGERKVSSEEGLEFALKHDALFMEVSAKTGDNVTRLFEELGRKLLKTPDLQFEAAGMRILNVEANSEVDNRTKEEKRKCCSHVLSHHDDNKKS